MAGKWDKPEDVVLKLRQVEMLQGQGMGIASPFIVQELSPKTGGNFVDEINPGEASLGALLGA